MSETNDEDTHYDNPEPNGNKIQRCIPIESYKLLLKEKNRLRDENEMITSSINQSPLVKSLETRNKELENTVTALNASLKNLEKENTLLSTVILKQEEKVSRHEKAISNRKDIVKKYEESINDLTLMNEELKQKIVSLKQYYNESESKEITNLKNKLMNLENVIEIKDSKFEALNKKYKLLQEKYLKLSSEKRLKPQVDLLNQAKEMKMSKMDKEFSHQSTKYQNHINNTAKTEGIKHKYSCNDTLPLIMRASMNGSTMKNKKKTMNNKDPLAKESREEIDINIDDGDGDNNTSKNEDVDDDINNNI